jgi:hypothetical protein
MLVSREETHPRWMDRINDRKHNPAYSLPALGVLDEASVKRGEFLVPREPTPQVTSE